MVLLNAKNPEITDNEGTQVKVAASASDTSIDVDNTGGFAANDYIVIGELGTETCEAVRVTAVTDTDTLAVTALVFAHSVDEPVRLSKFNQIRFYSSSDSFASSIADVNIHWDNPNKSTPYNDTSGSSTTTYKFSYYNSQTTTESDKSNEFSVPTYYCSIQDVADYLNLDINQDGEIKSHQVAGIISRVTEEVNSLTNSSFVTETISTSNYEYHDGKKSSDQVYFLENKPLLSISSLQITQSAESLGPDNATWTTLTEDDDFVADLDTSAIRLIDETIFPTEGKNTVRVAYTWGHSTVPEDIRLLATLLSVKHLMASGISRSVITGKDGGGGPNIEILNMEIDRLTSRYLFGGLRNT